MAEDEDKYQKRIFQAVKKLCLNGDDCGWPACGCDCQIFARDVLPEPKE